VGLLRAILERPGDDALRLVFAGWHEEFGDPARAEFIRDHVRWESGSDDFDLLDANIGRWCPWFAPHDEVGFMRDFGATHGTSERGIKVVHAGGEEAWWSRGFIWRVCLPLKTFTADDCRFIGRIFAEHPVTAVTLTGRHPNGSGGMRRWWSLATSDDGPVTNSWWLTSRLFGRLKYDAASVQHPEVNRSYATEADAYAALSRACVDLGRELAELPPLAWPGEAS